MFDRVKFQLSHRKIRDRSTVLLIVGAILFLPPVGAVSLIEADFAGIPVPLLYIFTVWLLLITGTAILSRHLSLEDAATQPTDTGEPEA